MVLVRVIRPLNFSLPFVLLNALTYMTLVIGRSSLDAILPSLVNSPNELLKNNEDAALIVSIGHMGYFLSKLFAGLFMDCELFHTISINYFMIMVVIGGCLCSLFFMSISFSTIMLMIGWFTFRGISSWLWIVMTRIIYNRFKQSKNSIIAWSFLSIGSRAGQLLGAIIFSVLLIIGFSWRFVLLLASIILFLSIIWNGVAFLKENELERKQEYLTASSVNDSLLGDSLIGWSEASTDEEQIPSENELKTIELTGKWKENDEKLMSPISSSSYSNHSPSSPRAARTSDMNLEKHWIFSIRLWAMVVASACVSILFEINSFFPIYLINHHTMKAETAALFSTPLYLSAFLSLAGSAFIYDQLSHMMKTIMTLFSLFSAMISFLTISLFPDQPLYCVLIMGFIIGFSLAPVNYLPANIFSIFFGGKESCAKISAILESISFAVTALVDAFVIGPLIKGGNWTNYFSLMVGISFFASIVFFIFFQLERKNIF